ncbi:MAG: hypothetical protein Q9175_000193 [Cornicularia normoerica]
MATGEAIVKKAVEHLKSTLTSEDVRMFSNTSLEDLWREARNVEDEQGARQDLRFMRRLEPFLRSLESYAGVIEVFCQGYAPMAFVWGPIKLMLLLARNYSSIMEKILQAFSDIADVLPRLDRLKATFPEDTNFNQVVGLIYSDIIEFHQRAYKFFRRKAWHIWFAFDWGLFERRFKMILQKLALHCELLDKEAAAAHFSEMKQFRDKRQLEEDTFERQRQNQMAQDVFRWLSAAEDQQEEHLHRISDKRQPETCSWVLRDVQMRPWIEDDSGDAVLWMTGIPGAGKSFLCSLLVQHLQTQQRLSTLYYFCGHQSSNGDTCAIILRTLAIQLLQQNLDMASLVHQAYLQKGSNRSAPAMKKLLIQLLPTSKIARIVIDGIDEGLHATQQDILKSLIEIQKSADHYCKLLVSSRNEPQIQKSLAAKIHLKLGEQTIQDLSLYIKDRIKGLQASFPEIDSALVALVEQHLHRKAKGMFLWVRLVTDTLVYQISETGIENAIDQLPEGLDEAYGLIISRIDSLRPQLRQRAFNILYWLCAARRPISLHEVADGIVLHPGQIALNRKTRSINPKRDIIELCAPLLEILQNGVLDLVHFSAKEYFVDEQSGPFIDLAKAHLSIALSCVINLTSCLDLVPRTTDGMSEADLESRVVQGCYGLQSYGQEFWAEHVLAYLGDFGDRDVDARKLLGVLEAFSQENDLASPSAISFGTRVPYWSLPEKSQFPVLLQRCGRDFSKIADHLKTKTPKEINQYFVHLLSIGNSELSDLADLADARLVQEASSIGTTTASRVEECEMQAPNDLALKNSSDSFQPSQFFGAEPYSPHFGNPKTLQHPMKGTSKSTETKAEFGKTIHGPTIKKRRPRPRVLCPHCSTNRDGLRDEYALEKHIERYHAATRKVWVCEDISINKRFLTNCISCSAGRRYSSKHSARDHLRMVHFSAETSTDTLQRWMRETEEPNLKMQMTAAGPASTNFTSVNNPGFSARESGLHAATPKRQKTQGTTISLPPLKNHPDTSRTLPSMMDEINSRKPSDSGSSPRSYPSVNKGLDGDVDNDAGDASLSSPEAKSSKNDIFLEDVSFDNFLPGNANKPGSLSNDGPPHRINHSLIKPDQVSRLPNLNSFQKAACLDQVDALYHKLDNVSVDSYRYREALENLTTLSRSLLRNLRDWRRRSTLAPSIPFSI